MSTATPPYTRVLLVGDFPGIPGLKKYIPKENIVAILTASNRPQYHAGLQELANELGCECIIQPQKKDAEYDTFYQKIKALNPDILICNSYSMKIQDDILELVHGNAFNVHGAYLPINRGAHPENWALIKGEKFIGATLHYMSNQMDGGDIVYREKIEIKDTDTWVDLNEKIVALSEKIISEYAAKLLSGNFTSFPQDASEATANKRLNADYPEIKFSSMTDEQIYNLIRAQVHPLKGAFIQLKNGERQHFNTLLSREKIAALRAEFNG